MLLLKLTILISFLVTSINSISQRPPKILSSLYGYDNCIGGVNDYETEEEYLDELKRRNCTVENGHTNVADASRLVLGCGTLPGQLKWLDGMPVVFNYPLQLPKPDPEAFQLELSDGSQVNPDCVATAPADESNELDTLLLLGQFGDGKLDTVRPVKLSVIGDVPLVTDDGQVNAKGLTFSNPDDMNYISSSVKMVSAKLWDVLEYPEDPEDYPHWPLPSNVYPNDCVSVFDETTHVLRVTFSGGITSDGIMPVLPNNKNIFKLTKEVPETVNIGYLGLADLGKTTGDDVTDPYSYQHDGDNYLDICLDMSTTPQYLEDDLVLELLCDETLEKSLLYPPKGKPFSCKYQKISLTFNDDKFLMSWEIEN